MPAATRRCRPRTAAALPTEVPVAAVPPTPQALALLANKNLMIDAPGVAEINAGRVDARVVGVLTQLSQEHKITLSALKSADGGMEIAAVDGEVVNPDSGAARDLASALAELPPGLRRTRSGRRGRSPRPASSPTARTRTTCQSRSRKSPPRRWRLSRRLRRRPPFPPRRRRWPPCPYRRPSCRSSRRSTRPSPTRSCRGQGPGRAPRRPTATPDPRDSQAFLPAIRRRSRAAQPLSSRASRPRARRRPPAVAAAAPDAYPGDDAPKEQLAAWMAGQAEKRGLPPELPVMAALVESGMKNLNYGDADSVGFFQMRVGIWDQGPYEGFADKPELQVKWFLDEAEKVKNARVAAGKPIDDPDQYGEWIADTERPAAQYRYRYQTKLVEAQGPALQPRRGAAARGRRRRGHGRRAVVPAPGRRRRRSAPPRSAIAKSQLGVREVGTNAGPKVDEYLVRGRRPVREPVVRVVHHLVAGEGRAQDARRRLGRGPDVGAQRRAGQERAADRQRRRTPAPATSSPTTGAARTTSAPTATSASSTAPSKTASSRRWRATTPTPCPAWTAPRRRQRRLHPRQRRRAGGRGGARPAGGAAVQPAPAAASPPVDPKQFGGAEVGTGGPPNAEALALLENKNVVLDDAGKADIKAGRIDPRVIGVLTKLSQEHKITVSCMCSDHSKFTAGGSVSNHFYGRGLDIASIDGEIVGPGSPLAREIASEVSTLDPNIRPNEIGSPFAISGPGYFTDAAHQNHLHLGFKQEIPRRLEAARGCRRGARGGPRRGGARAVRRRRARHAGRRGRTSGARLRPERVQRVPAGREGRRLRRLRRGPRARPEGLAGVPAGDREARAAGPGRGRGARAARRRARGRRWRPAAAVDVSAAVAGAPDRLPRRQRAEGADRRLDGRPGARSAGCRRSCRSWPSLVESGMKNLNYGDADSVGFFQMRVGIWNQGAYAGYPDKPELQVKWFLDQAEAVKKQRIAAGKSVTDPNQFGDWIADVERPAEQYRGPLPDQARRGQPACCGAQPQRRAAAPVARPPRAVDPGAAAAMRRQRAAPGRRGRGRAAGDRERQRPGPKALAAIARGLEVHGHGLQVGRLDAADRLRLLRADAVGLRAVGHPDPARDLHADRGAERHRDRRPRARSSRATSCSSPPTATSTTSACTSAATSSCTRPHTGDVVKVSSLERAVLRAAVRGRAALRPRRAGAPSPPAAAPAPRPAASPRRAGPRRSTRPRSPRPRPPSPATPPRCAATTRSCSWRSSAAEASKEREPTQRSAMFLKAVDPSQARAPRPGRRPGRGGARRPRGRRSRPPPRRSRPRPPPRRRRPARAPPASAGRGVAAASVDLRRGRRLPGRQRVAGRSSPSGWPSRPRRPGSRPSCR